MEACHVEHAAQKVWKEAKVKVREETEKRRIAEEEKMKKRLEYIQQLQDELLVNNAALLEGVKEFQVMKSKCKEVILEDKRECWPSKKAKGKQPARYCGDVGVKMGVLTLVRDMYVPGRIVWCIIQDE